MKRYRLIAALFVTVFMLSGSLIMAMNVQAEAVYKEELSADDIYWECSAPAECTCYEHEPVIIEPEPEFKLTSDEVDLVAWVTIAEAEGESELGQRLVIDTILNRVESGHFPDNVHDVVYQKNQFSCTTDGRMSRCSATDEVRDLVLEEAQKRTNDQTIFFRTKKYSKYGEPLFKEGAHYFSAYRE